MEKSKKGIKMKYSVVIPMYNSEKTIVTSIKSVEGQTRYDLIDEIIVINDGSKDMSEDKVKKLQISNKKLKLINKSNGGAASARNLGIKIAKNDCIALLDADDMWYPQKLEIQDGILRNNPEIKALGSNRYGEAIRFGKVITNEVRKISPLQYCIKNWPCTPSLVFKKSVFNSDDYFPEDMSHAEEGIFFLYLSHSCGLFYSTKCLVECGNKKRAFGESGLSGNIEKMHKGVLLMYKRAARTGYIKKYWLPILFVYEELKYFRRMIIVRLQGTKGTK